MPLRWRALLTLLYGLSVVAAQELPDGGLAGQLAAATPDRREALAGANRGAITADVIRQIRKQSEAWERAGRIPEALELERFALRLAEQAGDRELEEQSLHATAAIESSLGHFAVSVGLLERAMAIGEEAHRTLLVGRHANELSIAMRNLGRFSEARHYGEMALGNAVEAKSVPDEARARNAIGNAEKDMGRRAAALAEYLEALRIAEREHLQAGIGFLSNNIGGLYAEQGNHELALRHYERSLQIKEAAQDPARSTTLTNMGSVLHALGRDGEAVRAINRGLEVARAGGRKHKILECLRVLAIIARDSGKYAESRKLLGEAIGLSRETGTANLEMDLLTNLAETELAAGEPGRGVEAARRAMDGAREQGDDTTLGRALDLAGEASFRVGRKDNARRYSEEAIEVYDRIFEEAAGGAEDLEEYFEAMLTPYRRMVKMEADAGRTGAAFSMSERARARVLGSVMASGRRSVTRGMNADEKKRETALRAAVAGAGSTKAREAARLDYRTFLNSVYARHPELRIHRAQFAPLPAGQVAGALPDSRSLLLQYFVSNEGTYLFTVSKERGMRLVQIKAGVRELRKQVESYRERVAQRDLDYEESGRALYRLLLAPVERELQGKTQLVILPDGPLWQLPFQALLAGDGQFVGQKFQMSYAPSVTALAGFARRRRGLLPPATLLAMGQGLPEAEEEARTVGTMYGAGARVLTGPAARESTFKEQAGRFDILHLAAHGILENTSPMYSYIALGRDRIEDGHLEAAELMNLELRARVVVLSACDTGRGRIGAGEGMLGLTWALAVAGVPATVASGWKVDSKATAALMVELHRGLRRGLPLAAALQQAAVQLTEQREYRHPYYWSSFSVYGLGW